MERLLYCHGALMGNATVNVTKQVKQYRTLLPYSSECASSTRSVLSKLQQAVTCR